MAIRIIQIRHSYAPPIYGCRWCGFVKQDHHRGIYTKGREFHKFTAPTAEQVSARWAVHQKAYQAG